MIETSTSAPRILIDILITMPTLWVHISVVEVGSDWVLMYMCSCQGIHSHYNNTYHGMQELAMITMTLHL